MCVFDRMPVLSLTMPLLVTSMGLIAAPARAADSNAATVRTVI
jgi:hypothetical protein